MYFDQKCMRDKTVAFDSVGLCNLQYITSANQCEDQRKRKNVYIFVFCPYILAARQF